MPRYLLDTNVLVRAASSSDPQHLTAVQAMAGLASRGDELVVTPQVLIELWSVATRPTDVNGLGWDPFAAADEVDRILGLFDMLEDVPAIFEHWLDVTSRYAVRGKQVHDARLVASMLAHGVRDLLTFNIQDFSGFADVSAMHPSSLASGRESA